MGEEEEKEGERKKKRKKKMKRGKKKKTEDERKERLSYLERGGKAVGGEKQQSNLERGGCKQL